MAKYVVAGNSLVVTSEMTLEALKTIKKYRPRNLTLWGGKDGDEPIFTISTEGGAGINEYGATFKDEARDGSGLACITVPITYNGDDVKEYIADKFGGALINLEKIEEDLAEIIAEIEFERESVLEAITIA